MPEPVTGHEWTAIVLAISAQIEASGDSDEIAELDALCAKCADWRDCAQSRPCQSGFEQPLIYLPQSPSMMQ